MFLTAYGHDMLMVHPPPPTTLIFGLVEHPPMDYRPACCLFRNLSAFIPLCNFLHGQ